MTPTLATLYLLIVTLVVALIGTIDAAVSHEWDLFVVFVMVDTLIIALLARTHGRRPSVPIRGDLVNWLRQRAAITGDSMEALADRAIASFRQSTDPDYTHRHSHTPTGPPMNKKRDSGESAASMARTTTEAHWCVPRGSGGGSPKELSGGGRCHGVAGRRNRLSYLSEGPKVESGLGQREGKPG